MNIIKRIQQFKYPKEFRVIPVKLHYDTINKLEDLINGFSLEQKTNPEQEFNPEKKKAFYAEVSIGAWRLKKKMTDPKNQQPLEEMGKAYRHLESIMLTLEKEGIEIKDHDGQPFDSGLSIKSLAFQPTPGIKDETMIETIKPSVYYMGERIVMGEVIVGTPI
ncbi:nucleotide exchange factor GrpE [Aureibaculum conchae]|uniref:hypothetical protein n=1 Tax=Aureibaculum sp. 2308TA14-22 TaxID=3108392 RepID=UPI00339883F2